MPGKTAIEWTNRTWNPVTGCTKVSAGCENCYAERITNRFGNNFAEITLHEDRLQLPRRWRQPSYIFVNSMSDLFHPSVDFSFVDRVFDVMRDCPQHVFQILTKRPSRMKHYAGEWPDNVWAGTSIESAEYVWRADQLRQVSSGIRFLSIEPLIAPTGHLNLTGIHWVIVGGESGPGYRRMQEDWAKDIRDQCVAAEIPFFFKQWGGHTSKAGGRTLEGELWSQFPAPSGPLVRHLNSQRGT